MTAHAAAPARGQAADGGRAAGPRGATRSWTPNVAWAAEACVAAGDAYPSIGGRRVRVARTASGVIRVPW